jgi:NADPH2:quinone reductase
MHAIRVHRFGEPEVMQLEDVPRPQPRSGELLVRVLAVGVNPVDTYVRAGTYATLPEPPYTPGSDAAGALVPGGARVYLSGSVSGTYAEFAVCRHDQVHPLPESLTYAQGAALGTPYATAARALFQRARAASGDTVFVHGASGAVGLAAVQLALGAGHQVVGTAGSDGGRDLVAAQGSVHVLDHTDPHHFAAALKLTHGRGFDVIIEPLANANLGADLTLLASGGRLVVVGSRGTVEVNPRELMRRDATVLGMLLGNASEEDLAELHGVIAAGLANGSLQPVVGRELPLADAPRAHHLLREKPALGKLVLVP